MLIEVYSWCTVLCCTVQQIMRWRIKIIFFGSGTNSEVEVSLVWTQKFRAHAINNLQVKLQYAVCPLLSLVVCLFRVFLLTKRT